MEKSTAKPFNQRIRIWALRLIGLGVLLPLIVLTRPLWAHGIIRDLTRLAGTFLIVAGVLGRFWAILYIGARKNRLVMQDGPYSMCRHPLYLSSTLGVAGFGLLLGGISVAVILTLIVFAILFATAGREEAFLRDKFGATYSDYAARVPRILPRLSGFHTPAEITVQIAPLRMTYADALVFIGFFPLALGIDWLRAAEIFPMLTLP